MLDEKKPQISRAVFRNVASIVGGRAIDLGLGNDLTKKFSQAPILGKVIFPTIDFGDLGEDLREKLTVLAKGGWYPYDEMPLGLLISSAQDIFQGKSQDADNKMSDYFEKGYKEIKSYIIYQLPKRNMVLDSAFQAHERGEYLLSIPVFLAQADGVCFEMLKIQLYSISNKKSKITTSVDSISAGDITKAFLSPISDDTPLTANFSQRDKPDYPEGALNRHQILHGEVVDYGTKINSIKAISLLCYLCDIQKWVSKKDEVWGF